MKAVIFGAGGQDGVYLAEWLGTQGIEVTGLSRANGGDVADYAVVECVVRRLRPDYLFHLAARSTTRHDSLFENHATISSGVLNVLEAVRLHAPDCRVFITGSGVQFANAGQPISERDPFAATSPYAVARIHSVYAARYYRTLGVRAYVGYLFHHESPLRGPEHLCMKIAGLAARVRDGAAERIEIGDLTVRKEAGFAGDIVKGIWTLVSQNEIFEAAIGTGTAYSVQEWAEACFARIGRDWRDHVVPRADVFKPEYFILVSDPATIRSLGWRPETTLEKLAEMMVENVFQQGNHLPGSSADRTAPGVTSQMLR
jgi:GDPmannose 4,6-dehydratase